MGQDKYLLINRSAAIALLARLGLSDIPFFQSKQCRNELISYLSNVILNNTTEIYEEILKIDVEDLKAHIEEHEDAIKILTHYTITK